MRKLGLRIERLTELDTQDLVRVTGASGFTCTGNCQSQIDRCQTRYNCPLSGNAGICLSGSLCA